MPSFHLFFQRLVFTLTGFEDNGFYESVDGIGFVLEKKREEVPDFPAGSLQSSFRRANGKVILNFESPLFR